MLQVNNLVGFGAGGGAGGPVLTFIGSHTRDGATADDYTFTSVSIGTATADRLVIVSSYSIRNSGNNTTLDEIAIGGVAGTIVAQNGTSDDVQHGIGTRVVTTGTTANIKITARCNLYGIGIWTLTGYASSTPSDTSVADTNSTTLSVTAGGVIVAGYGVRGSGGTSTWSGATEDFDNVLDSGDYHSGASEATTGVDASYALSAGGSGGTEQDIHAAFWT